MSQEKAAELREILFMLERKIRPLEWDAGRNQINEFKMQQLIELQKRFAALKQELNELEKSAPENVPEKTGVESGLPENGHIEGTQ
ncbi:MAG: hypothetical protein AB1668_05200 [Nanoarchaeota archaeon]